MQADLLSLLHEAAYQSNRDSHLQLVEQLISSGTDSTYLLPLAVLSLAPPPSAAWSGSHENINERFKLKSLCNSVRATY